MFSKKYKCKIGCEWPILYIDTAMIITFFSDSIIEESHEFTKSGQDRIESEEKEAHTFVSVSSNKGHPRVWVDHS